MGSGGYLCLQKGHVPVLTKISNLLLWCLNEYLYRQIKKSRHFGHLSKCYDEILIKNAPLKIFERECKWKLKYHYEALLLTIEWRLLALKISNIISKIANN